MIETNDFVSYIKKFHAEGWMPGSAGAIALLTVHNESSKKISVTPDKFDINTLTAGDLYTLRDLYGTQEIQAPLKAEAPISRWAPTLFLLLSKSNALCAAFLPTRNASLVSNQTLKNWKTLGEHPNQLRLAHWGLLTNVVGSNECIIPIVDCSAETAHTHLEYVYSTHVQTFPAVLVRNYGLLTWESSLPGLKNKVEILERLFDLQLRIV